MLVAVILRKKFQKADATNKPLEFQKSFLQKILTRAIFLLAPTAKVLGTSNLFIGCMKWQHAVILEPIWETDSILIYFPA